MDLSTRHISAGWLSRRSAVTITILAVVLTLVGVPAPASATEQSVTFTPATAANFTNSEHCVIGTLSPGVAGPAGIDIVFEVIVGSSIEATGTAATGADGTATFCYPGPTSVRNDVVTGFGDLDGSGTLTAGDALSGGDGAKFWVEGMIDLTPATAANFLTTEHCVTATLSVVTNPFGIGNGDIDRGGHDIVFQVVDGISGTHGLGTVVTADDGTATLCYDGPELLAHQDISAFADFNGDDVIDPGDALLSSPSAQKFWVEGMIDLTPATAANFLTTEHCVTATLSVVTNPFGVSNDDVPRGGHDIVFEAFDGISGTHGLGTVVTADDGTATLCYDGPELLTHQDISAFADFNRDAVISAGDGLMSSPTARKFWVGGSIDLTPATATNFTTTEHCVTATLNVFTNPFAVSNDDVPRGGHDIVFEAFDGISGIHGLGTVVTADDGTATLCYDGPELLAHQDISAFADFNGDGVISAGDGLMSSPTAEKVWVEGTIDLTPATATNFTTTEHCVTATLSVVTNPFGIGNGDIDLGGHDIVFASVDDHGNPRDLGTVVTDAAGVATACYEGPTSSADEDITAFADFNRDGVISAGDGLMSSPNAEKVWVEGTIDLTPATATNFTTTEHCVTATLGVFNDPIHEPPLGGYDVMFRSLDELGNEHVLGSAVTADDGTATLCYDGPAHFSTESIFAFADFDRDGAISSGDGLMSSPNAEKVWVEGAIDLSPTLAANVVGTEHCVTSTLNVLPNPPGLSNEDVDRSGHNIVFRVFDANGFSEVATGTATSAADGTATFCYDGPPNFERHDFIEAFADFNEDGVANTGDALLSTGAEKYWNEGRLTLTPADATNLANTEHCVIGEFTTHSSLGGPDAPQDGYEVVYSISSGGSPVASGTRTTDGAGGTTFCYTGPLHSRVDEVNAFVDVNSDGDIDPHNEATANPVAKTWVAAELHLAPFSATNPAGTEHCVTGFLSADDLPVGGYNIVYSVASGGSAVTGGTEVTEADGTSAFCYVGPSNSRSDEITAFADLDNNGVQNGAEPDANAFKEWVAANTPPTVGPITAPLDPVSVGSGISASADFTDPDLGDAHTATWDWGDGETSAGTVTEPVFLTDGHVTGAHTYATPGIYTVTLTVDDGSATGSSVFRYIVVYDPEGGFVTGGGWIDSPVGSLIADPTKAGRANFGFSAKYKRGATTPSGVTEFQFKAGSLNFHSSSYEWLVVSGARAQYKGVGTINGSGNYGFKLTAIDGRLAGGGGSDRLRMKIWDLSSGAAVYDNQPGSDDLSDASTALGGGSIIIHKG